MKIKITILSLLVLFLFECNAHSQAVCQEQVSGVTATLTSVYAMTSVQLWVCGYNATVLRTTNGGTNWINVSGNGIPATRLLINVAGISTTTALVAGYEGTTTYVYHTSNSGANWTQVFMQANGGFINAINMRSASQGYMQGDPVGGRWSLWKTTNGGLNWDSTGLYLPQAGAEAGWSNSMVTHNGSPGPLMWFGTNNSRIYYSTNGGINWSSQSTAPEVNTYSIYFPYNPSNEGLSGGATLIRTSNLGTTWSPVTSTGTGNINGITGTNVIVDNQSFLTFTWYIRGNPSIYFSGNNGSTWAVNYTAPGGNYRHISLTDFSSIGTWYAVRDNGGITKGSYNIGAVNPINTESPENFSLSQNYPNPFNPGTTFKFSIAEKSFVKLAVYNSIGAEIEILVNKVLSPAVYEAHWNAYKHPSGVYFYRIETDKFSETKKMVMIK